MSVDDSDSDLFASNWSLECALSIQLIVRETRTEPKWLDARLGAWLAAAGDLDL